MAGYRRRGGDPPLLAARWLTVLLFSTDRVGYIRIATDATLLATALTDAVAEEIKTYPGVHSTKARLIGDPTAPDLVISASLQQDVDLRALRHRIEANAVAHARQALDNPHLRVILDLTITESHSHNLPSGTEQRSPRRQPPDDPRSLLVEHNQSNHQV
ncbi:hypothetical protein [Mycobacterium sp. ENV421]|uniref:hypothetical protein n=1 Tax=Mycobacterium sp. ENV421 TaxID=1213407 RepID=UPI0018EB8FC2|nr:hypothetical protein [Mycobacterium sp. ENV421]